MQDIAVVVRNSNRNITPIETIDTIQKAGYKHVFIQWYDENWICSQQEQLEYIKNLGLNVIFAHLGYQNINSIWEEGQAGDDLVKRYQQNILQCSQYGIPIVVLHLTKGFQAPMYNLIRNRTN